MVHSLTDISSSLIKEVYWNDETNELTVVFRKYFVPYLVYQNISRREFSDFISADSIGQYYLKTIKQKTMSEKNKPRGVNKASDQFRWLDISINVDKINKEHIYAGEKGNYLGLRVRLMPDGTVDQNENCGFVVQKLPKDVKGEILGNIRENQWSNSESSDAEQALASKTPAPIDDLPF